MIPDQGGASKAYTRKGCFDDRVMVCGRLLTVEVNDGVAVGVGLLIPSVSVQSDRSRNTCADERAFPALNVRGSDAEVSWRANRLKVDVINRPGSLWGIIWIESACC